MSGRTRATGTVRLAASAEERARARRRAAHAARAGQPARGPLERLVLEVLAGLSPAAALSLTEVCARVRARRPGSQRYSVGAVLSRLTARGLLARHGSPHYYHYYAAPPRSDARPPRPPHEEP